MTGKRTRGRAARDIRTRHPACRPVAQGEFRHAVREWCTVCRCHADGRGDLPDARTGPVRLPVRGLHREHGRPCRPPAPPRPRLTPRCPQAAPDVAGPVTSCAFQLTPVNGYHFDSAALAMSVNWRGNRQTFLDDLRRAGLVDRDGRLTDWHYITSAITPQAEARLKDALWQRRHRSADLQNSVTKRDNELTAVSPKPPVYKERPHVTRTESENSDPLRRCRVECFSSNGDDDQGTHVERQATDGPGRDGCGCQPSHATRSRPDACEPSRMDAQHGTSTRDHRGSRHRRARPRYLPLDPVQMVEQIMALWTQLPTAPDRPVHPHPGPAA